MQFTRLASLNDLQTRKLICVKTETYRILVALAEGKAHTLYAMLAQDFKPADIGIRQNIRATALPDNLPPAPESKDVSAAFVARAVKKWRLMPASPYSMASKAVLMMHCYTQQQSHCGI